MVSPPTVASRHGRPPKIAVFTHADAPRSWKNRSAAALAVWPVGTEPESLSTTAVRDGVRAADELTPSLSGALFATEDLRGAVRSFLADGPGKATYTGR